MHPLGKNSASSLPSSAATRSSSRRVVGSPSRSSSPTSAAAMAARMAGVGFVTVSLRRSIGWLSMRGIWPRPYSPQRRSMLRLELRLDDGLLHHRLLGADDRFVDDQRLLLHAD